MKFRNVMGGAIAMAYGMSISAVIQAQSTVIMSDDFEAMDKTAATLSGDWLWQKQYFTDAGCLTYGGQYPDNPEVAKNQSYFTVKPSAGIGSIYDEYSNQGLIDNGDNNAISGSLSLNVYQDTYSSNNDACHRSRTFKTVTTTSLAQSDITPVSGNYKITGKAKVTKYDSDQNLATGAKVGVFFLVVNNEVTPDASNAYGVMVNTYREVDINGGGVKDIAEDFELDLGDVQDISITAGFYSQNDSGVFDGGIFDDFVVSFGGLSEEEKAAAAAEKAACEDTSTIRFEEEFGDVDATCLTDTYSFPADAEDWGGYADKIKDESIYPFGHFYGGGSISFDCEKVGTGSQRIQFKFEVEGFPGNTSGPRTDWATCTAPATTGLGRLSEVVATQDAGSITLQIPPSPRGESYNNLIMYLETKGGPSVKVTNVSVNAVRRSDPNSGAATGQPSPGLPIPVLPFWALLALVTATGLIAVRKR